MQQAGIIEKVNGPVVVASCDSHLSLYDMVYVGTHKLLGEVVSLQNHRETCLCTIQVYESTGGLMPGMPIYSDFEPLSLLLGPGLAGSVLDGIARPLKVLAHEDGAFLSRGKNFPSLDAEKEWEVYICVKEGDVLSPGQVYAVCAETAALEHKLLVPPGMQGTVVSAASSGQYRIHDTVVTLQNGNQTHTLTLCQKWPIRTPRPSAMRLAPDCPLVTGQRVIDTFFPVAKGGAACLPGPFGAGKTITQHQLAKWSAADIIVYIGCGERGNEITQVMEEFSGLIDPRRGLPLFDRTILIANTSNMPVASREASIYTGMTIAEYYRDMGYDVAVMADSTSRWAEALREISGRLEEMPAEEGFPAYLPSRLAEFYERCGRVKTLSGSEGSVTAIGAVSPQGSDFSEPVTQNTKRFTRTFWALDRSLAYARHFPAIHWLNSYSEYIEELAPWYDQHCGPEFLKQRARAQALLQEESKLMEIVKLIGADMLPDDQKLIIETARVLRDGFLQQNAYHPIDTYVPLAKQQAMLAAILHLYDKAQTLVARSIPISELRQTGIWDRLIRMKYNISNDDLAAFDSLNTAIDQAVEQVLAQNS
ncbi:MAG TPA: V-type ATP synthase subunit A [Clostridiales bacterium]|nr:V-type ATP synthase subunit A [Clostridiales bacterium]